MSQPETITITKIVNSGLGMGYLPSGQVIFVAGVLPGETVTVSLVSSKKQYVIGELQAFQTTHPGRRQAPCPYTDACGGCNLQHAEYPLQLTLKKAILLDLFAKTFSHASPRILQHVVDPLPSPSEFGYRQRVRLQVDKAGQLGFFRKQSHEIVVIKTCLLADGRLNAVLSLLEDNATIRKLLQFASEVELQLHPITGGVVVAIHLRRKPRASEMTAATHLDASHLGIEAVYLTGDDFASLGPFGNNTEGYRPFLAVSYPAISNMTKGFNLTWEVGGFCQVNLEQNYHLIATVLRFVKQAAHQTILDLYCGMGNFSIPLALMGAKVVGIEGQASSIRSAVRNSSLAATRHCSFQKNNIHTACNELLNQGFHFDCVIIDPPRQGAPGLSPLLAQLTTKIVYISCDPATLCRDVLALSEQGFAIMAVQPIDMFPQTHHIETVVVLEKNI